MSPVRRGIGEREKIDRDRVLAPVHKIWDDPEMENAVRREEDSGGSGTWKPRLSTKRGWWRHQMLHSPGQGAQVVRTLSQTPRVAGLISKRREYWRQPIDVSHIHVSLSKINLKT